eukprot:534198_1
MAEDKISILISIVRQLQHCNKKTFAASVEQIVGTFKENKDIKVLQSILLDGICKHYSNLKTNTLQQIHSILPSEKKLKINDSITKSQLILLSEKTDKNKIEPLTFLKIPS